MNSKYLGSCLCEKIKYEVEGSFESFYLCHCKYCQKDTGSAHAANLFSTKAKLQWIAGPESIKTFTLPSTRHTKSFCQDCGSAVPSLQMDGQLLVVPAGSLNSDLAVKPDAHIFCSSKAGWDESLEGIKRFDKFPL
jgi:hypothetical protein